MQLIRCAAVGVLMALYFSTDSWCHYIPEKKTSSTTRRTHSSRADSIQICGNKLTNFIIAFCNGTVGSFNPETSIGVRSQNKIIEECCYRECTWDHLQSYCEQTPLFSFKSSRPEKSVSKKLSRTPSGGSGESGRIVEKSRKRSNGDGEVRVRNKKNRKKRKRSFKRKCAYKSFGHYLLRLERGGRARSIAAKAQDGNNQGWPSIQIGTVSPEMDKFGGQPIVVLKKNRSNSV